MGIINKLKNKMIKKKNPIEYWRKMGAKLDGRYVRLQLLAPNHIF